MFKDLFKSRLSQVTLLLYALLGVWWIIIFTGGTEDAAINHQFGFTYGGFSLWGGLIGLLYVAKAWGGLKSYMGKAVIALSMGLLLQGFGQYSFWFSQSILHIELPYPSVPDIGFFGTIPFYIYAGIQLSKATGASVSLRSFISKLHALLIPLVMVSISYFLFLRGYEFDWDNPLIIFFDFGYPIGQAMFISVGILAYSLSWKLLGGVMKNKILLIVIAFFFQYLSDYTFVFFQEEFFPGHFVDFIYLTAYFLMAIALIQLKTVSDTLHQEKNPHKTRRKK